MKLRHFLLTALVVLPRADGAKSGAVVDHHQHLFRPTIGGATVTSSDLIRLLDESGIARAVVLSTAYQFSNPNRPAIADEYEKVQAENDWTSREVAKYPDRLRGFCSVNPLKDYALTEIQRCTRDPHLRSGLKLHFGNSDVDLDNPAHLDRVREVFRAANSHRMAIVVHMRPSVTRRRPYGASQAQKFLNEILPAAPDVSVQIAHLAGAGGFDDPAINAALGIFAEAISAGDARMVRVYFDASGVAGIGQWTEKKDLIVTRIRQLGIRRILFGSDGAVDGNTPAKSWAAFRQLPLTEAEFEVIANAVAPYIR